jgi:NADH-quinone oxidoreductase subunit B
MGELNQLKVIGGASGESFFTTKFDALLAWSRKWSLFQYPFATACCGMEFFQVAGPRYDVARFGAEAPRFSPRQSDVLWVVGTISQRQGPVLKRIYEQMADPKWVIAFGTCASCGGFYDNYTTIPGADKVIPVDVFIPGCPPRPEAVLDALMLLQEKITKGDREPMTVPPARGAASAQGARGRAARAARGGPRSQERRSRMSKSAIARLKAQFGDKILSTSDFRGDDSCYVAPSAPPPSSSPAEPMRRSTWARVAPRDARHHPHGARARRRDHRPERGRAAGLPAPRLREELRARHLGAGVPVRRPPQLRLADAQQRGLRARGGEAARHHGAGARQYYRVILGRARAHLRPPHVQRRGAMELGAFTPFLWILKAREWLWDILEERPARA